MTYFFPGCNIVLLTIIPHLHVFINIIIFFFHTIYNGIPHWKHLEATEPRNQSNRDWPQKFTDQSQPLANKFHLFPIILVSGKNNF